MTWVAYFEPGEGVALVGNGFALLTPAGRDDSFVHAMADLVDHPAPHPDELAARLVARDLRSLPPFVLAISSADDLRVLARGEIDVVIAEGADLIPVNGRHAHTWLERAFDPGSALHASCAGPELRGRFAVSTGLVPARTLQWSPSMPASVERAMDVSPIAPAAAPPTPVSAPVSVPIDEPPPAAGPGSRPAAAPPPFTPVPATALVDPLPVDVSPVAPAVPVDVLSSPVAPPITPPIGADPAESVAPSDLSVHTIVPPSDDAPDADHSTVDQPDDADADADAHVDADADALATEPSPDEPGASGDKDYLFGITRMTTVEQAAVRIDDDDANDDDARSHATPAPPPGRPAAGRSAPVPPSMPPSFPATPNPVAVGLIDSVPWAGGAPRPPTSDRAARDHDGRTRSVSDMLSDASSSPAPDSATPDLYDGPLVQAVFCPDGHPNPTTASVCWSCEAPIVGDGVVSVHRPPLGILAVVGGDRVTLDRTVVLGRQPSAGGSFRGEPPLLLAVGASSSEISRTHAQIRVDGWNVLLADLDSTNGTVVHLPGRAPERLRPNEPTTLLVNSTIELAREVTIRFEPFR